MVFQTFTIPKTIIKPKEEVDILDKLNLVKPACIFEITTQSVGAIEVSGRLRLDFGEIHFNIKKLYDWSFFEYKPLFWLSKVDLATNFFVLNFAHPEPKQINYGKLEYFWYNYSDVNIEVEGQLIIELKEESSSGSR